MRIIAGITSICLLVSGCAAGGLLDRSITDAELPVEAPASPYPTAIRGSAATSERQLGSPAVTAPATSPAAASSPATSQQPVSNAHISPSRREYPQPLLTPLAVIPPQFVHPPASPARAERTAAAEASPDQRRTLADLTPATNWTPPTVVRASISDLPDSTLASNSAMERAASALGKSPAGEVRQASATSSSSQTDSNPKAESADDRRTRIEQARVALVDALAADIKQRRTESTNDDELPRLEQQLRLAYVSAGRLDEAVAGIESLDETQREAFKNLVFGLGVWLSPDESHRVPLRSAKVLHSLRDATTDLAAAGKLEVRNLVFCERVDHFGWYSEFPRKEFQPKQQVILYAEVENFAAEHKGAAGFETELQGSYVILDSSGQEVASRKLQLDKEVCRNHRRDYFLAYRIYMPEGIPPGRYRLELTVEDLKARGKYQGRKLGEGVIEFTIR